MSFIINIAHSIPLYTNIVKHKMFTKEKKINIFVVEICANPLTLNRFRILGQALVTLMRTGSIVYHAMDREVLKFLYYLMPFI